jgi:hypothetical protein
MNEVVGWMLVAAVFVVIASVELILRVVRGFSLLRAIRDWLVKLFDTVSGGF